MRTEHVLLSSAVFACPHAVARYAGSRQSGSDGVGHVSACAEPAAVEDAATRRARTTRERVFMMMAFLVCVNAEPRGARRSRTHGRRPRRLGRERAEGHDRLRVAATLRRSGGQKLSPQICWHL